MRKSDYIKIAQGLAKESFQTKTHIKGALDSIFNTLHPTEEEQGKHWMRFSEMSDAYDAELDRLYEAEKSPLERAKERNQREALGN